MAAQTKAGKKKINKIKPDIIFMGKQQFHQYHEMGLPNSFTPFSPGTKPVKFYDKCPICGKEGGK